MLGAEKLSTSFKLERLKKHISNQQMVVVLHGIDQPPPKERNTILYNLCDLPTVGLVCVCNSQYVYFALEERVKSRLNPTRVLFEEYMQRTINAAIDYENSTGGVRKIGITGEVGEVLACYYLKLKLCIDPRAEGYDALDFKGHRVQIKTRRSESEGLPNDAGRIGTFSNHPFDYVLLIILDRMYNVAEIWQAKYRDVWPLI